MNKCDVIMSVVIKKFVSFKCAQRVILLVCKVSLSFHISLLSYRGGAKKPRGNRVKLKRNNSALIFIISGNAVDLIPNKINLELEN